MTHLPPIYSPGVRPAILITVLACLSWGLVFLVLILLGQVIPMFLVLAKWLAIVAGVVLALIALVVGLRFVRVRLSGPADRR